MARMPDLTDIIKNRLARFMGLADGDLLLGLNVDRVGIVADSATS